MPLDLSQELYIFVQKSKNCKMEVIAFGFLLAHKSEVFTLYVYEVYRHVY